MEFIIMINFVWKEKVLQKVNHVIGVNQGLTVNLFAILTLLSCPFLEKYLIVVLANFN
jgi:hypothetical protein